MSGASGGVDEPPDKMNGNGPPASLSTTSAWALGGGVGSEVRMRTFAEILLMKKLIETSWRFIFPRLLIKSSL